MGVINMAHGEFIMIGAYTGYVVQQFIPDYTISIIVALPLAFAVAFMAGVALERLVIRYLAHRPLETLLATFGISIALQQIAKNIFGTQARPLTSPSWLDGAWVLNDVVSISYIRIAIFVLALIFLGLLLFILNRTRLGLEVRAVTQNPRMASSMGINPDRINMLTFGLGSGIAGIAGVAIGLFAQGHLGTGLGLHRAELHDRGGRRCRQHLGHAGGRRNDRLAAEAHRVLQSVQHACRADLHDHLHHHFHSVPAQGHHRAQGPCGGGLSHYAGQDALLVRQPPHSVLIFILLLAAFTLLWSRCCRKVSGSACLDQLHQDPRQDIVPVPDRHRHGSGLGLLRDPVARPFRLLRPRRLHDRHVADV
jgi:hypothetical protein